jgi:protein-S-isoprenylcysteine O-methyltransferase Ste14
MFVLIRTLTYASIFIAFFLVLLPERILAEIEMSRPDTSAVVQAAGLFLLTAGALVVAWSVLTFAFIGRGTPAPFDPPRRLVVRGPYRYVRNPMYIAAMLVLSGITVYFASFALLFYSVVFWGIAHLFVVFYEEPVLKSKFEKDYTSYKAAVNRWWPKI